MGIYSKFSGLYNIDDTIQTWEERRDGIIRLKEAENVDIDNNFKLQRRSGFVKKLSGNYKSVWSNDSIILAVKDKNLTLVDKSLSSESIIMSNVGDLDMVYVGREDGVVYFTNGSIIGKIESNIASYLSTSSANYKQTMPAGYLIEIFNGRLYVAKIVENKYYIIYSIAYGYEMVDERHDPFNIGDRITMLKAVSDGIWFSTLNYIYFAKGGTPTELSLEPIAPYGCREGAYYSTQNINVAGELYKNAIILNTDKGICVAGDGGIFKNLTESKYIMPPNHRGTGVIKRGNINQFITIVRD